MKEREYLQTQLDEIRKTRGELPGKYDVAAKEVEQHIEKLMETAGILSEVRRVKTELTKYRDTLQKQADLLAVKIEVMEFLFDKYHRDPVEEGETLYGIDISKLDWQTRLMVKSQNIQTIQALGGDVAAALAAMQPARQAAVDVVEAPQELTSDTVGDVVTPTEVHVVDEHTDEQLLEQK